MFLVVVEEPLGKPDGEGEMTVCVPQVGLPEETLWKQP